MRRPFSTLQRWPLVIPRLPRRKTAQRAAFGGVALAALGAAIVTPGAPFVLRFVLAIAGLVPLAWSLLRRPPTVEPSGSFVVSDGGGLTRVTDDGETPIVKWDAPFGVALLASYRPHAVLAFTTPTQTRYVPARIDGRNELDDELLARVAVLADLDLVDGVAHDAALTAESTAAILRFLEGRDKSALGRAYLSDNRGRPIALDPATLAIGERTFDLTSALEWRSLNFHEATGSIAGPALYQATWIRQAGAEVVLVAPMPSSLVPRDAAAREAAGKLGRALTRDIALMQAPVESPPMRDVRVAIDRPFMMAVRRALADAPLAKRVVLTPPARKSAERRGPHA